MPVLFVVRRADPALPDPQGAGAERHAADLPDLCAVAAAAQSRADAVHAQITAPFTPRIRTKRSISAGFISRYAKLIAFVVAMGLSGALWVFLHTTDLGKAMRAASQNRDVAMLMGINPNRVFCVALGVALALAGAAGSLLMPFYSAYPFVGQVFVLMAFVAVVLGTLGNVHRRAGRQPDDGSRGIARHSVRRRRFRTDRGVRDAAADAGVQADRALAAGGCAEWARSTPTPASGIARCGLVVAVCCCRKS